MSLSEESFLNSLVASLNLLNRCENFFIYWWLFLYVVLIESLESAVYFIDWKKASIFVFL